jgi:hypothetical protein
MAATLENVQHRLGLLLPGPALHVRNAISHHMSSCILQSFLWVVRIKSRRV